MTISSFTRAMVLFAMLLTLLAGCAASSNAGSPVATVAPAASGEATLVLWHGWSGSAGQALTRLVDRFNQQYPESRVFAQQVPLASMSIDLRAAVSAGAGPQLMLLPSGWLGSLAADDVLLSIDSLVSPDDQRPLLPVAVGAAQATGRDGERHLYGQPLTFDTLALFYNKANVLAAPETTTDLFDIARGLSDTQAAPPRWGLALNLSVETTIGYLYAFEGQLFDDSGQLVLGGAGRAGSERWLGWIAGLGADERLLARPYSSVEVDRAIRNGQGLMTFGWAHQAEEYRQLWGDQFGIAPLPRLAETNRAPLPYVQSDVLAVNGRANAAEQRTAANFLKFMASTQAQTELLGVGLQPTNQDLVLDGDSPLIAAAQVFREQAASAQPLPNTPNRAVLREELWQMQRSVLESRMSPADAVTEAAARLQAALKE